MKLLVVLAAVTALCAGSAIPVVPGDNSHYVEGESRYIWMPDGLDPAGPQWGLNAVALNRNDGQYVEAIHTNGGRYGIFDRSADADFYPNGGRRQPGCWTNVCSHGRAFEIFASTVRYNHLNGRACSNINQVSNPNQCTGATLRMGNAVVNKRGSGIFALTTRNSAPF
ncbi:unnamed protein product [Arctia plantaginis]|uniref:Lipase domain-containing protein n=1 Tax=Arctia plantaginis TaxID=874455 RepID=A0A8S1A2B5_ARCPL|nr:unnamed protein product [Arctia plantaginis]